MRARGTVAPSVHRRQLPGPRADAPTSPRQLADVRATVLLIVDGHDDVVLGLNRQTQTVLRAPSKIAIVTHPGANPV